MLQVIIFDADGVLVHGKRRFSVFLAEEHGIPLEKTLPFFEGPFQDCLVGKADLKKALLPYLKDWGWKKGVETFLEYWFRLESETDQDLIEYVRELKRGGIKCFLATNNEKYRFEYMLDKMGFSHVFDKTYASAHLGKQKTDLKFFEKVLKDLKDVSKKEILFVDDDPENIKTAKKFGLQTELFTSLKDLRKKVALLGR